ncbi:hypothetical protein [Evansella halocellulosilytica]|uniref:hypothetical protein n=1 Tax=Evansella halocellulosilytica TaxID=2011013 RepID=UPI0027B94072|nr:hypothetical protein [Evansella halocellulosilytica]
MISIEQASEKHVEGIMEVCTDGYWATYGESYPEEYLERIVNEFYNKKRILHEVTFLSKKWGGYFVALENGIVRGAGGGGMIREQTGEIFVLYINPE